MIHPIWLFIIQLLIALIYVISFIWFAKKKTGEWDLPDSLCQKLELERKALELAVDEMNRINIWRGIDKVTSDYFRQQAKQKG